MSSREIQPCSSFWIIGFNLIECLDASTQSSLNSDIANQNSSFAIARIRLGQVSFCQLGTSMDLISFPRPSIAVLVLGFMYLYTCFPLLFLLKFMQKPYLIPPAEASCFKVS
jgi:hypothetical protein